MAEHYYHALCPLCRLLLMLSVTYEHFMLSVVKLNVLMLNVIMLNVIMLSVVMLNVVMLSAVAL